MQQATMITKQEDILFDFSSVGSIKESLTFNFAGVDLLFDGGDGLYSYVVRNERAHGTKYELQVKYILILTRAENMAFDFSEIESEEIDIIVINDTQFYVYEVIL